MKRFYMNRLRLAVLPLFLLLQNYVFAQEQIISGRVTAANDQEALPGVSITKKGTTQQTATDNNGNYRISASSGEVWYLPISVLQLKKFQYQPFRTMF